MQSSRDLVTRYKRLGSCYDASSQAGRVAHRPRSQFVRRARYSTTSVKTSKAQWDLEILPDELIHDPKIDLRSLKNTVQAHREANLDGLIRKYDQDGTSTSLDTGDHLPGEYEPNLNLQPTATSKSLEGNGSSSHPSFKRVELPAGAFAKFKRVELPAGTFVKSERFGTCATWTAEWKIDDLGLPRSMKMPWINKLAGVDLDACTSPAEQLTAEISAFDQYISPDADEAFAARVVIEEIKDAIQSVDDKFDVEVIGSRATGIADAVSDIDINVTIPSSQMSTHTTASNILMKLEKHMRRRAHSGASSVPSFSPFQVLFHVKHAKVPILICRHRASMLEIQIQSSPRAWDSTEYAKVFLKEHPTLKSIYKVVKQTLLMRGLTQGVSGGLTSYPLLNMIVASLKFSERRRHPLDSGNQLLDFLDLYGDMDFTQSGISTRPLEIFSKEEARQRSSAIAMGSENASADPGDEPRADIFGLELAARQRLLLQAEHDWKMVFQDPANPDNDLGKGAWRIRDVQSTLLSIRYFLRQALAQWTQPTQEQTYRRYLMFPMLAANYMIHEQERGDLRAFARNSRRSQSLN